MAILSILFTAAILVPKVVSCDYVLEVRAHSYLNQEGKESSGQCCDSLLDINNCNSLLGQPCDNVFVFCLRYIGTAADGNTTNCPLGRYSTGVMIGGDNFIFATPIDSGVPNPMTFTGSVWPGVIQLYVSVYDVDPVFGNLVDDIYITKEVNPNNANFTSAQVFEGFFHNSEIVLSFRVQCTDNFYGPNCTTLCINTDDHTGHYNCTSSGGKVCLTGWRDPNANCLMPKFTSDIFTESVTSNFPTEGVTSNYPTESVTSASTTSVYDPTYSSNYVAKETKVGVITFASTFVVMLAVGVLGMVLVHYLTKCWLKHQRYSYSQSQEPGTSDGDHSDEVTPLYDYIAPRDSIEIGENTAYAPFENSDSD